MTAVLALAILAILIVGDVTGWFDEPSFSREILSFFVLSNVALFWAIGRNLSRDPADFVKVYLGATVLRILFFGGFILAVILLDEAGAAGNTLFFLACYFLFTIMEVGALWVKIKS